MKVHGNCLQHASNTDVSGLQHLMQDWTHFNSTPSCMNVISDYAFQIHSFSVTLIHVTIFTLLLLSLANKLEHTISSSSRFSYLI